MMKRTRIAAACRWLGAALLPLALLAALPADDKEPAKAALPADLDLVPREAAGFLTVRVADLWDSPALKEPRQQLAANNPQLMEQITKAVGVSPSEIERATIVLPRGPKVREQGVVFVVLIAATKPVDKAKVVEALLPGAKETKVRGQTVHAGGDAALYFAGDRAFAMGPAAGVELLLERPDPKKGANDLSAALALAAGKHPVVGGLYMPTMVKELPINEVPPEVEAIKPVFQAQALYGHIELGKEAVGRARMTFATEDAAARGEKAAQAMLDLIRQFLPIGLRELEREAKGKDTVLAAIKEFENGLKDVTPKLNGAAVEASMTVKLDLAKAAAAFVEATATAQGANERMKSTNNLKQIGLALHNYHDTYGSFPPAAVLSKDGKPLLSWRVLMLPYLENDALYKEFKLDEPWDSDHNKKLLAKMPKVFAPVKGEVKDSTFYRGLVGGGAFFEEKKKIRIAEITDGTSNTIMVVEAGDAVPWTKPDELPYDPDKPLPKLGGLFDGDFNALFADGAVRFLKKSIDEKVLRGIITRAGGEVVRIPQ